ncbi:tail fiber domain-containing protein, partial [Enterobacter roggenkampii]
MSAGTITLTNGSAIVGGSGTSFATELAAGDFIVSTVGGVPYTLPVKTVDSNTQVTLVSNFTGPTQAGAAWSAVPRVALNMVTAALVAQSAEALRGLNYDKQNWQSIFSGNGNVTVTLPDGTKWTGPAWNSITTILSGKAAKGANDDITSLSGLTTALSLEQGGTGSTTATGARKNLGLGTSATKDTGTTSNDVMQPGMFGLGRPDGALIFNTTSQDDLLVGLTGYGL